MGEVAHRQTNAGIKTREREKIRTREKEKAGDLGVRWQMGKKENEQVSPSVAWE